CQAIDKKTNPKEYEQCLDAHQEVSLEKRISLAWEKHQKNLAQYQSAYNKENSKISNPLVEKYVNKGGDGGIFNLAPSAQLHYVENVPYAVNEKGEVSERIYGNDMTLTNFSAKGIHAMWHYSFLRSCIDSAKKKRPVDIYVNNAYLFPSGDLLATFGAMLDGSLDCHYVTVHLITNSPQTTDLAPINLVVQSVLKAIFGNASINGQAANFKLYEYASMPPVNSDGSADGRSASLHSKVIAFDNSIYIGSANFDTRSIVMDTNNGFYITGDQNFVNRYKETIRGMISDGMIKPLVSLDENNFYKNVTEDDLVASVWQQLYDSLLKSKNLKPNQVEFLKKYFEKTLQLIYAQSHTILNSKFLLHKDNVVGKKYEIKALNLYNLLSKEM
ncbi:MAG: phospholipase D-like domain-containing protein, partial [Pseudomonadota bacterium]